MIFDSVFLLQFLELSLTVVLNLYIYKVFLSCREVLHSQALHSWFYE